MKTILLILPLVLLAACSGPVPIMVDNSRDSTPTPQMETVPQPTPTATLQPTPRVITKLPDGCFTLVRCSIQTPDGIEGVLPGTEITQEANGIYTYRGNVLSLAPNEVTTDREQAAKVQAQFLYMANKLQGNTMTLRETPRQRTTPTPRVTATPFPVQSASSLDRGTYNQREGVAQAPILGRVRRK